MDALLQYVSEALRTWLDIARDCIHPRMLWEQFFVGPPGIFYWENDLIYLVGGVAFFIWRRRGKGFTLKEALRYVVPPELNSPAVKVDVQFFLYDLLGIRSLVLSTFGLMLCVPVATRFVRSLELCRLPGLNLISAWALQLDPVAQSGLGFALALLGAEFVFYWYHRLAHSWSFLWQFHKVHHYSREMNPLVAGRVHDFDETLHIQGMFLGSILFVGMVFPGGMGTAEFNDSTFWMVIVYQTLLRLSGRFAHSHIPVSLGPVLDRVINTALIHQMHHSRDKIDLNFGHNLSLWDTVFGTLYRPAPGEKINFGINEFGDEHYRNLLHAQVEPYQEAYRILRGKKQVQAGNSAPAPVAVPPPDGA